MNNKIIIAPSILACDFGRIADEVRQVEEAGADWIHIDIMDGHFVPNLTMGPDIVTAVRKVTKLPLDIHLMIQHPESYAKRFVEAGGNLVTVHQEAEGLERTDSLRKMLESIRGWGARAGLSIRPKTASEAVSPFLSVTDLVLVMSVEPGFGGQAFIPEVVPKVRAIRERFGGDLSVDGGINIQTGRVMRDAGANVLVAGSSVFRAPSYREAIQSIRGAQ